MTTFIDKTRIFLKAGSGGNGCLSFRREKFVPLGGPNGGNGGKGGDIYVVANPNMSTLIDVTYRPHYTAQDGEPGHGNNKYGRAGEDIIIYLPSGTVVRKNGVVVVDLSTTSEKVLAAQSGRGGRGNASFKTQRQTAPYIAELGQPGEECVLELELKTIADVGLVGYPNAGKSTFLAHVSNAHPKIADYPFTTLSPNLGRVIHKGKSFIIADIPGIIDDAHLGKGLGIEFLRHIERTKVLIHLVDLFGYDKEKPFENWKSILKELKMYGHDVENKPYIVALNKIDVTGWEGAYKSFMKSLKSYLKKLKKKIHFFVIPISAVSGKGMNGLLDHLLPLLDKARKEKKEVKNEPEAKKIAHYLYQPEFSVEEHNGVFIVKGKKVEDFVAMTNFDQEEAVMRLQHIIKKMGINKILEKQGIKRGQPVRIGTFEFAYE